MILGGPSSEVFSKVSVTCNAKVCKKNSAIEALKPNSTISRFALIFLVAILTLNSCMNRTVVWRFSSAENRFPNFYTARNRYSNRVTSCVDENVSVTSLLIGQQLRLPWQRCQQQRVCFRCYGMFPYSNAKSTKCSQNMKFVERV